MRFLRQILDFMRLGWLHRGPHDGDLHSLTAESCMDAIKPNDDEIKDAFLALSKEKPPRGVKSQG